MTLRKLKWYLVAYVVLDLLIGYAGVIPLGTAAAAQFTTVTGTVVDPNGLPYANGTIVSVLILPGGTSPTLSGLPYSPPTQPVGLDATGSFTLQLADNNVLLPGGTTWNFTVCSALGTVQPAGGKGPVCFTLASPITITGTSQSISANLNAVALALTRNPGTGTVTASGSPVAGNIPKFTTATNIAPAAAADLIALWTGCSGTQYLGADGACHNSAAGLTSWSGDGTVITNSGSVGAVTATIAGTSGGVPYFNTASSWASSSALTLNAVVLGGGAGAAPKVSTGITTNGASELDVGVNGGAGGVLGGNGSTSGKATFTFPAVAGTATNPVTMSNVLYGSSQGTTPVFGVSSTTGMSFPSATQLALAANSTTCITINPTFGVEFNCPLTNNATGQTQLTFGTSIISTTGTDNPLLHSTNNTKAVGTSDFTSANSAALQAITGLSFPLGSTAQVFTFHCALMYSQATNVAGDQFGVGVITTAPTNVNVTGVAYTNTGATAAAPFTGQLNALASTTPTAVVTFQPAVTSVLRAELDGTIETAGGGAATFNVYVLNGTAADVIVVKRGSYCTIY
jgi:hypothetical protein